MDTIGEKIIDLYERYGSHLSLALNKYSGNMGVLHYAMEGFFNGLGKTSRAVSNPCGHQEWLLYITIMEVCNL